MSSSFKEQILSFKFDESLLSKWDQRTGHAPPPYTGAMARLLKGIHVGDPHMDAFPMSKVICHGGKTKEEIKLPPHPEWVDWDSVRRGQQCFCDNLGANMIALSLMLIQGFSIGRFADVLVANGYAQSANTAFERYTATSFAIMDWMKHPIDLEGSVSQQQLMNVRAMHSFSRRRAKNLLGEDVELVGQAMSQFDVAEVLLGFSGILPLVMEHDLHFKFTLEQRRDMCHCWRLIGYHLGLMDEFNVCNSLEDMEQMVLEFMQFTPVRWRTCRPSTFELQHTALEGFGAYTGVGVQFFMGVLKYSCKSREWGVDYLEGDCLPGMDIVGGMLLNNMGNPLFSTLLNLQMTVMRKQWADNPMQQRSLLKFMAFGARFMDTVVWRALGLIALEFQSYMKRFLLGFLLGFFTTRQLAVRRNRFTFSD